VSAPALDAPSDRPFGGGNAGAAFYVATLTFRRQRQLKEGARPRVESGGHTLVRVALLEVMAGLVACEGDA
jgi:DNA-directed RNA polymerase subunit K/omega